MSPHEFPKRYRNRAPSTPVDSQKPSRFGQSLFAIVLIAGGFAFAVPKLKAKLALPFAKTARLSPVSLPEIAEGDFEVIGLNDPITLHAIADLELRTKSVNVRQYSNPSEIMKDERLFAELSSAGLMTSEELRLPFVRFKNRMLRREEFVSLMASTKPKFFEREASGNYVVVYGVNNCGRTTRLTEKLKALDIPFTYFDLNSAPEVGAKGEARLHASGYPFDAPTETPIVEVNGLVVANPDFDLLRTQLSRAPSSSID